MRKYMLANKGYFALFVFVSVIYSIATASVALLLASILDAAAGDSMNVLVKVTATAIAFISLYITLSYTYARMKNKLMKNALLSLKSDIFSSVMKKKVREFEKSNSAAYINELTTKATMMEDLYFNSIFSSINLVIRFITAIVITIYYQPYLLIFMAVLGFITTMVTKITGKGIEKAVKLISDHSQNYQVALKEFFLGFRVIKAFSLVKHTCTTHNTLNNDVETSRFDYKNKTAWISAVNELVGFLATAIIMACAAGFAIKGYLSIGVVFAVGHLMGQVTSPISSLPQLLVNFKSAATVKQELQTMISYEEDTGTKFPLPAIHDGISIHNLRFGYGERNIFDSMSYSFTAGKKYAIIGASGSGKSTLLSLLLGHFDGYSGSIQYDGLEVRDIDKEDIYRKIGVVFQDTFLFDDTIRNNLTLFDESLTDEQIMEAIALAGLTDFIHHYPNGLDGRISENGKNISGGERQRMCLVRIFLRKQQILFLDEFTANLDSKTAYEIERQLLSMNEITVLTITHRLNRALLMEYDGILVLRENHIVESGTFTQLLANQGYFASLMMISSDE